MFRVGIGYDVHRLASDRKLVIGGVHIPFYMGLVGHSDADVLLHALSDALLGAIGQGDIGRHFPDTDPAYKDADSIKLLAHVWSLVKAEGYRIGNADMIIVAQRPKMAPHIPKMIANIAAVLECDASRLNIKATTSELIGFVGREEGMSAQAIVSLTRMEGE